MEVRNITKKISDLNCKLDSCSQLAEPRENSYIEYAWNVTSTDGKTAFASEDDESRAHTAALLESVSRSLNALGQIKTSKTFPSLCRCTMDTVIAHLEAVAKVTTIDYNGETQVQQIFL